MKKYSVAYQLQEKVGKTNLCTGCGVCVGLCAKSVLKIEKGIVKVDKGEACVDCQLCTHCCPALGYKIHDGLGLYKTIYEGYSTDENIQKSAASGGVLTQLLVHLIKTNEVDKVVVVENSDDLSDGLVKTVLTDSIEEITTASKSKYIQSPISKALEEIRKTEGFYAVVGTPCQLYGISKAMEINPVLRQRIKIRLGLFCGYVYSEECIDALLTTMSIPKEQAKKINGWRVDGFPGSFAVEKKDGSIKKVPFEVEHGIDVTFYSKDRCRMCADCFCEYGDIVAGDIGRSWKEKKTLIVSRSEAGEKLLNDVVATGEVKLLEQTDSMLKSTNIEYMEKEKRTKAYYFMKYMKCNLDWSAELRRVKITNIEKLTYYRALHIRRKAIKNMSYYIEHPEKMRKIGHYCYAGIYKNPIYRYPSAVERLIRKVLKLW